MQAGKSEEDARFALLRSDRRHEPERCFPLIAFVEVTRHVDCGNVDLSALVDHGPLRDVVRLLSVRCSERGDHSATAISIDDVFRGEDEASCW